MATELAPGPLTFKPLPCPSQYGLGWGKVIWDSGKADITRKVRRCPDCRSGMLPVSYSVKIKDKDGRPRRITQHALACRCNPFPPGPSMASGTYLP